MSHALAFKKNLQRLTRTVHETVDKTTTKTQELSPELVEVEENVQKLKTVYTAALKNATESMVSTAARGNQFYKERGCVLAPERTHVFSRIICRCNRVRVH